MAKHKMVKVKMLVNTAYQGPRREGEVVSVPEDFAKRWAKNGIAEYVHEEVEEAAEAEAEEVEAEVEKDIKELNAKELYALCKEKGIDVEAKKSKEYYLEKLA